MASLIETLGIDRLSVDERMQLVEEICEGLGDDLDRMPLTEAQTRELDRRVAFLDANPHAVTPWQVVEAEAIERLKR